MGRSASFPPLLKRKSGTNEARTCYRGRYYTCGRWDTRTNRPSEEARERWKQLVALWTANPDAEPGEADSIGHLVSAWLAGEDSPVDIASRNAAVRCVHLLEEWRPELVPAAQFGVGELREWQNWLCNLPGEEEGETRYGRRSVKRFVGVVLQAVKWGWPVGKFGVTAEQFLRLKSVPAPKAGKVREPIDLQPVPFADVVKVAKAAYPHVRAILLTLWWTGARTDELLGLKLGPPPAGYTGPKEGEEYLLTEGTLHVHKSKPLPLGEVWAAHVVSKVRKKIRVIVFGPKAQAALRKIVADTLPGQYLFRPMNGRPKGNGPPRKSRAVEGCRPGRERYKVDTLDQALRAACKKAGVKKFRAYQLRHSASQRILAAMGAEAEGVYLGHGGSSITRHYGGINTTLAARVAARLG